jgi:hypothetical protein
MNTNIHVLPFRDVTAPLYSMHLTPPGITGGGGGDGGGGSSSRKEGGGERDERIEGTNESHGSPSIHSVGIVDCTHYCYFPQMWESLWTTFSYTIMTQARLNIKSSNSSSQKLQSRSQQNKKERR